MKNVVQNDVEQAFNIVLVEPEIPPNTGNIARLCGATNSVLHLVGPLGFSLDEKHVRRAGLDYWSAVDIRQWKDLNELQQTFPDGRYWYTSKKATCPHTKAKFLKGDFLVFGKETEGLPEDLMARNADWTIRIPIMNDAVRSLNLATAAGVILYEALRQTDQLA